MYEAIKNPDDNWTNPIVRITRWFNYLIKNGAINRKLPHTDNTGEP